MKARNSLLTLLAVGLGATSVQAADEVVVYSSRIDELIKPVFDAYTAKPASPSSSSPTRKPR